MTEDFKKKLIPLALAAGAILLDQLSKLAILIAFPQQTVTGVPLIGDFLSFIHVRNTGIAFSIGAFLDGTFRFLLMIALPLGIVGFLGVLYWRGTGITRFQGWLIMGIIGGGLGNLIDRVFRPEGVVDFVKFKMYGLFGMQYFPPFNVADSFVVVGGILFAASWIFQKKETI